MYHRAGRVTALIRTAKTIKSSTIEIAKLYKELTKPVKFENRVFCLFALMKFDEMSEGREFKILEYKGREKRQIDVFAKDESCHSYRV